MRPSGERWKREYQSIGSKCRFKRERREQQASHRSANSPDTWRQLNGPGRRAILTFRTRGIPTRNSISACSESRRPWARPSTATSCVSTVESISQADPRCSLQAESACRCWSRPHAGWIVGSHHETGSIQTFQVLLATLQAPPSVQISDIKTVQQIMLGPEEVAGSAQGHAAYVNPHQRRRKWTAK